MVYRQDIFKKGRVALRGLDLAVEEGEIFGYVGPNGAGKTTTIKCLVGLVRPTSGKASIFGKPVESVESRESLGFLPEEPYFYEYLTGTETMEFYARLSGLRGEGAKKRAGEVLELVGLSQATEERVRGYSRGMRQRLGLASAIVHNPRVVILDEPMGGLDPAGRKEVRDLMVSLRDSGATVFLSTHIISDVEALCDRVGMLSAGRLVACGTLSELVSGRVKAVDATVEGLATVDVEPLRDAIVRKAQEGKFLHLTLKDVDAAQKLIDLARARGARVVELNRRTESLEEVFLREAVG